jgi:hypothetical protein
MEWPDGVAQQLAQQLAQQSDGTRWESRADGHPGGCPTESGWAPVRGGRVPDGGRMVPDGGWVSRGGPTAGLGRGPTGEYIRAVGPHF